MTGYPVIKFMEGCIMTTQITKNQYVLFPDGHKGQYTEVFFSVKHQSFAYASEEYDDDGKRVIYYSNDM